MQNMFIRDPKVWVLERNCFQHQYALMVLDGIKTANAFLHTIAGFAYHPTPTKLLHLWREKAVQVYQTYCKLFGSDPTKYEFASRVPPKCISGRWGFISRCERYVLSGSAADLRRVREEVFTEDEKKNKGKKRKADLDTEVQAESTEAYKEQMGRWAADVRIGVASNDFFYVMMILRRCREPLDHFHLYLQRRHSEDRLEPTTLAKLVWGKAQDIHSDLAALCNLGD